MNILTEVCELELFSYGMSFIKQENVYLYETDCLSARPTRYCESSISRIHFVVASNTSCILSVRIHLWFFRFSFPLWLSLRKQKLIVEPVLIPCSRNI